MKKYCLFFIFSLFALFLIGLVMLALPASERQLTEEKVTKEELQRFGVNESITSKQPKELEILIYIIDVDEVDSAKQSFSASLYYEARWKEPDLAHEETVPIKRKTTELWTPRLTIISQQNVSTAFPEIVEIDPDGTVVYRQKIWGIFSQPLEFYEFPFDQQSLSFHLVAAGLSEKDIKIVPLIRKEGRQSAISEEFSLLDFDVSSWQSTPKSYYPVKGEAGIPGYELKINIARHPNYYFLICCSVAGFFVVIKVMKISI